MFQFSLRSLLVAVTVFAVGTAALLSANPWWSALLWGAALLMLAFAGLMVLYRRDAQRAFWGGFLLAGSLYVLLLMRSVPDANGGGYMPLNYNNLITTKVTVWAYFLFPSSRTSQWLPPAGSGTSGPGGGGVMMGGMSGGMMGPGAGMGGAPMNPNPAYLDIESFTAIGHALWTLFLAWLGGMAALWAFSNRDKRNAAGTEAVRTTP